MYDWKGQWVEQDDNGEEKLRSHCVVCGAFLPKNPEQRKQHIPDDWNYVCDKQGEVTGVLVRSTIEEVETIWVCKKCGKEYDAEDMYS